MDVVVIEIVRIFYFLVRKNSMLRTKAMASIATNKIAVRIITCVNNSNLSLIAKARIPESI